MIATPPLPPAKRDNDLWSLNCLREDAVEKFRTYEDGIFNLALDRMHAWSECYAFFKDHLCALEKPDLDEASPLLKEAVLQLAVYLACFGMYVRKARLLVLNKPLLALFREIGRRREEGLKGYIANNVAALAEIDRVFTSSLKEAFREASASRGRSTLHLTTLKGKVYSGIFAAVPALDTRASSTLQEWKKKSRLPEIEAFSGRFDEKTLAAGQALGWKLEEIPAFRSLKVKTSSVRPCPTMRKLDLPLWAAASPKKRNDRPS